MSFVVYLCQTEYYRYFFIANIISNAFCQKMCLLQGNKGPTGTYEECITDHPGFEPVCLNTYVLDTAHNQYKQQYNHQIQNIPEKVVMKK